MEDIYNKIINNTAKKYEAEVYLLLYINFTRCIFEKIISDKDQYNENINKLIDEVRKYNLLYKLESHYNINIDKFVLIASEFDSDTYPGDDVLAYNIKHDKYKNCLLSIGKTKEKIKKVIDRENSIREINAKTYGHEKLEIQYDDYEKLVCTINDV